MKTSIIITAVVLSGFGILGSGCSSTKPKRTVARTAPPPQIQRMTATWEEIRSEPAAVEVLNMKPVPLVVGEGKRAWARVPGQFAKYRTSIFTPTGPVNGVADYRVTASGYFLVACNFDYQGNSSGGWQVDRWTRAQFYDHGWREATAKDLGGVLVNGGNLEQVIFVKKVAAGESGRLRCNKYDPPFFIVCSNEPEK